MNQKSLKNYQWKINEYDKNKVLSLCQKFNLPEIVGKILFFRGITENTAYNFLNPSIKNYLPDPSHLLDMDKASEYLSNAVISNKKITIYGDYDVDGATSSALLQRFFKMLNINVDIYIPDRMTEGYGPNITALKQIKDNGTDIVITVDCGTVSFDPIKQAKDYGLDIIVIDHHLSANTLPDAVAIVNPNRLDETSEHKNLAAVGVSFLLTISITRYLRNKTYFKASKEPDLLSLLDIVALGTICDVMTITGLNRAFVAQGLKIINKNYNKGLSILSKVADIKDKIGVYHCGFIIGPRINAGGRIGKSDLGAKLLTTSDVDEAYKISLELDKLNLERRAIEEQILEQAIEKASEIAEETSFILIKNDDEFVWHKGVIGIVASRIKEKLNKPCAVLSLENGIGNASVRSIYGVDIGAAITSATMEGLLIKGGGHAMAAGFSIEEEKISEFIEFMEKNIVTQVKKSRKNKILKIDSAVNISAVNLDILDDLECIAPYGNGNPEPNFMLENVKISMKKEVGTGHFMVILKDSGLSATKTTLKAMAFRSKNTPIGDFIENYSDEIFNVVGKIKLNEWNGVRKAEFIIDDIMVL